MDGCACVHGTILLCCEFYFLAYVKFQWNILYVCVYGEFSVDFNPWRTLPKLYFIIPESLVAPCTVVFAQIVNKQTNKLNYIYRFQQNEITYDKMEF